MKKEQKKFQALILIKNLNTSIIKAPLCSILEKILQSLEMASLVDEIFIFTNKDEQIFNNFLSQRKKKHNVKLLFSECGESVGDRLREIHRGRDITTDFILIK